MPEGDALIETDFWNILENWKHCWSPLDVSVTTQQSTAALLTGQVGLGVCRVMHDLSSFLGSWTLAM